MLAISQQRSRHVMRGAEVLTPVRTLQPVPCFGNVNRTHQSRVGGIQANTLRQVTGDGVRAGRALEKLTGRWTIPIVWELCRGPVRLGQLSRILPGASRKVITETLRRLEVDGLLFRTDLSGRTKHVEYHLNPEIRVALGQLMDQLAGWGLAYDRVRHE